MKTFQDLVFKDGQAEMLFSNGYGVNVIPSGKLYELAVIKNDRLCYDTPVTASVERTTGTNITKLMQQVQELS